MVSMKESVDGIRAFRDALSRSSAFITLEPEPPADDLMTVVAKVREKVADINRDLDVLEARLKERERRQ